MLRQKINDVIEKGRHWLGDWIGVSELDTRLCSQDVRLKHQIAQLTAIAADVSVYGESTIVIVSRIGGGRVKIINANFTGLRELTEFIDFCNSRYGSKTKTIDAPLDDPRFRY